MPALLPCPAPLRVLRTAPLAVVALLTACTTTTTYPDAGPTVPSGITFEDIGTPCTCNLVAAGGSVSCDRNPTNSCARSALTCVISLVGPAFSNAGNALWEGVLFSRAVPNAVDQDGGAVAQVEGECTLRAPPGVTLACPSGTVVLALSDGSTVCKRQCFNDTECGRSGWVCDTPLLDRNGLDMAEPAQEVPLNLKLCRPACEADFPHCNRSTPCTMGRPGCQRSALTPGAPVNLGLYVGDRNGGRTCNRVNGHCETTAARTPGTPVGSPCQSHENCDFDHLCVSDGIYSDNPTGIGFCTYANCNPFAAADMDGCPGPLGANKCQVAFEMGMCFANCANGTLCGNPGQKCSQPDPYRILNLDPTTGGPRGWSQQQCVDCNLTGVCP